MKRFVMLFLWVIALLLLGSCAPDPRSVADAEAIRMKAAQDAADREQNRQQNATRFALKQTEDQSLSSQWVASTAETIFWGMKAMMVSIVLVTLSAGVGISWGVIGAGRAAASAAWLRAHLVSLDTASGQYPMLVKPIGNGRYTLTDINTGLVLECDVRSKADSQMVAAAFAGRLNAATAYQARMAGPNAEGVSMLGTNPIVVTGGSDGQ